jgi:type IV secretory pathway TrbF-like protein
MARERSDKSLERFLAGDADQVDVNVENVILGELRSAPYTAQIDLVKVYRGHDGAEIRREKCVETVTFDLAKDVPNSLIETNPLGITVTALPVEDVAYTEGK